MVDGEPRRPSKFRRLTVAIARAIALFILIAGLYVAITIGLPQFAVLNRAGAALLIGVIIFEMLRRPGRIIYLPAEAQPAAPDNSEELAEAQHAVDQLRGEVLAARTREASAREEFEREHDQLQRAATRALEEIQRLRTTNDELRGHLETHKSESERRVLALNREIETHKSDAEKRIAEATEELDAHKTAASEEIEALKADRQRARRDVEEAKQKAEVEKAAQRKTLESEWNGKLKDIQRELELTRATAQKLLQSNGALKEQLDEERQRFQGELQRIVTESKNERDEMQAEARAVAARLEELLAQLDRERKLSTELSSTRARLDEENAALRKSRDTAMQRALQLERQMAEDSVSAGAAIEQLKLEAESARQQLENDWGAKLQKIVNELASDHENEMGEAIAAREAARAEVRSLTTQMNKLQERAASAVDGKALRETIDAEWSEKLQKIVTDLTTDHENDIGEAIAAREAARAEVRSLTSQMNKLQDRAASAVDEKALREKIDAEWSEKLQKIVSGLTTDHENDIGEAIAAREAARAEVRSLTAQLNKMQERAPAIDEKALREKIDAEWSAKLQTIVSHIASDHEADVGKAIEEREAARAEVRNLNAKLTAMQSRLRAAEDQLQNVSTQKMPAFREPEIPNPPPEAQARADVLQFAEQAFEAIRKATGPGDVPVPAVEEKRPRILIVHHDPTLRAMWRDSLRKSGFDVQTAADGAEGLRMVKSDKPDVVIADVSMPKMNGHELCHHIKSNEETALVKVILLTGVYTNEVPLDAAKKYEADELLRKPVKLDAMKAALQTLLPAAKIAS